MKSVTIFLHYMAYKKAAQRLGWTFMDFERFKGWTTLSDRGVDYPPDYAQALACMTAYEYDLSDDLWVRRLVGLEK